MQMWLNFLFRRFMIELNATKEANSIRNVFYTHHITPSVCLYNVMFVTKGALDSRLCEVKPFRQVNPLGNEE